MQLSEVEKTLQRHDEAIKRIVEELRSWKNSFADADVDSILGDGADGRQEQNRGDGGSRRGFAAMPPEKRSEIARKGGESSHGGRGSGGDHNSGVRELQAMQQFLREKGDALNEEGRRQVEEAIDKKRDELDEQGGFNDDVRH